jgi:hypothetical protein
LAHRRDHPPVQTSMASNAPFSALNSIARPHRGRCALRFSGAWTPVMQTISPWDFHIDSFEVMSLALRADHPSVLKRSLRPWNMPSLRHRPRPVSSFRRAGRSPQTTFSAFRPQAQVDDFIGTIMSGSCSTTRILFFSNCGAPDQSVSVLARRPMLGSCRASP